MDQPRALVIGGSLGGLFAANLLRSIGWDVAVFERTKGDLAGRGAGLGTRAELFEVMRRIGIDFEESIGAEVRSRIGLCRNGDRGSRQTARGAHSSRARSTPRDCHA